MLLHFPPMTQSCAAMQAVGVGCHVRGKGRGRGRGWGWGRVSVRVRLPLPLTYHTTVHLHASTIQEAWRAMEDFLAAKRARSIGVSH